MRSLTVPDVPTRNPIAVLTGIDMESTEQLSSSSVGMKAILHLVTFNIPQSLPDKDRREKKKKACDHTRRNFKTKLKKK